MNYFDHPYCSNSALTKFWREVNGIELAVDLNEAYRLGSLFDAVVTEPSLLDLYRMTISGTDYRFTQREYDNCNKMHVSLKRNPIYQHLMACRPEMQKEVYLQSVHFEWDGVRFHMPMKAKLDFFAPGMVVDLKSTACTTQASFEAACEQFDYWRQMVLYCRMTGAKKAMIFGVSKVNHKVFIVHMKEGDERWKAGESQLNEMAFKYYLAA